MNYQLAIAQRDQIIQSTEKVIKGLLQELSLHRCDHSEELRILRQMLEQSQKVPAQIPIPQLDTCYKQELIQYVNREGQVIHMMDKTQENIKLMIEAFRINIVEAPQYADFCELLDTLNGRHTKQIDQLSQMIIKLTHNYNFVFQQLQECLQLMKQSNNLKDLEQFQQYRQILNEEQEQHQRIIQQIQSVDYDKGMNLLEQALKEMELMSKDNKNLKKQNSYLISIMHEVSERLLGIAREQFQAELYILSERLRNKVKVN